MNESLKQAATEFLAQDRLAVAGVSRDGSHVANIVYRRLRERGFIVYPVNPNVDEVEGDRCYRSVGALPAAVGGVFIATRPEFAPEVVRQCIDAGVPRVWMHRSLGQGSVSVEAAAMGEAAGLRIIAGACPMMFIEPVDVAHRCLRWFLDVSGRLPA
jgi:uncharacterized protein